MYLNPECPYCQEETTAIIKNMDLFKGVNFYLFTNWPLYKLKNFYDKNGLNDHSNVTVGKDIDSFFTQHFKVSAVPWLMVYNNKKELSRIFVGSVDVNMIIKEIQQK